MYVIFPILCFNASIALITIEMIVQHGAMQIQGLRVNGV